MAKKKPRSVRVVQIEDYTPLEIKAIQVREWYLALRKAGFPVDIAITMCIDRNGHPDWFELPAKPTEDIGTIIDDEDED